LFDFRIVDELVENSKKERDISFIDPKEKNSQIKTITNNKSVHTLIPINGDKTPAAAPKELMVPANLVHSSSNKVLINDQNTKHLFNWEILNKTKYTHQEAKQIIETPEPQKKVQIGKLEALQYNPAANLSPIDEEKLKANQQKLNMSDQSINSGPKEAPKKSTKNLAKIDESLLSDAAKEKQIQLINKSFESGSLSARGPSDNNMKINFAPPTGKTPQIQQGKISNQRVQKIILPKLPFGNSHANVKK